MREVEIAADNGLLQIPFYLEDIQLSDELKERLDDKDRLNAFNLPVEVILHQLVVKIQGELN